MEESSRLHASAALLPGKEFLVPIGWEAGWAPETVWIRWWIEKFPAPADHRTPDHRARSSVNIPLSYPGSYCSNMGPIYSWCFVSQNLSKCFCHIVQSFLCLIFIPLTECPVTCVLNVINIIEIVTYKIRHFYCDFLL